MNTHLVIPIKQIEDAIKHLDDKIIARNAVATQILEGKEVALKEILKTSKRITFDENEPHHLLFYRKISEGINRELQRQKESGKEFLSDGEIDSLIDKIIQEESVRKEKLLSKIELEDAIEVLRLGEGYSNGVRYEIKYIEKDGKNWARLFYIWKPENEEEKTTICANFDDDPHSPVKLIHGNQYFRCHAKIYIYLKKKGYKIPYSE